MFLAFTLLLQSDPQAPITYKSLKDSLHSLTGLPKFNGIDLPKLVVEEFNPFDDFDDFQGWQETDP